jgi:hypothetical protein
VDSLTFVCWKWKPPSGYRSHFGPQTVNVLHSMLSRHYHAPFELVCVTDSAVGITPKVRTLPIGHQYANLPSPHGHGNPSCYRRLRLFSREAAELFGTRIVSMDLDIVITADVTALFDTQVDFRMYGDTARGTPYNGSLIQLRAGARPQVYESFNPLSSPVLGLKLKYIGSDQAWIGACLGPNERKFTGADGVYSYRNQILPRGGRLPPGTRIVVMHGQYDPWTPNMTIRHSWIKEHYR